MTREKRDRLVMSTYYYCLQQASKYANYKYELDDALQDALMGAMEAAEKFDEGMGNKFLTYASHYITRGLLVGLAEKTTTIKLPRQSEANHYINATRAAEHVGLDAAAKEYGLKKKTLRSYIVAVKNPQEITAIGHGIADTRECPETDAILHDMRRAIDAAMWMLGKNERAWIVEYYYNGMNLREIAAKYGYSPERVRQIIKRAMRKIRERGWHLRDFIDG